MTAIRVEVTADHIDDVDAKIAWADPVIEALAELTGEAVMIDGDGATGNIATIGQGAWTLVIELPAAASAWLNRRWEHEERGEPFAFEIEIPTWVVALIAPAASITDQAAAVIATEAAG